MNLASTLPNIYASNYKISTVAILKHVYNFTGYIDNRCKTFNINSVLYQLIGTSILQILLLKLPDMVISQLGIFQSRSCLVAKFDLQCTNEPSVFGLTSTCLLLHGGPQVSLDPSLASRRMRLAHIKSVPKDIPEESHSDIISTSRTKLSKGWFGL